MRILIITNLRVGWGGSEELWLALAQVALKEKHEVIISKLDTGAPNEKLIDIEKLGAKMVYRRGNYKPGLPVWKRVLLKGMIIIKNILINPYKYSLSLAPDLIVYNDSSYYIGEEIFFYKPLIRSNIPLFIINHIIPDFQYFNTKKGMERAKEIYNIAKEVYFVAERNLSTARRQLGTALANGKIVRNPINYKDPELIPYPRRSTPEFAVVANLQVSHKGQDILFEVLSKEKWKKRQWILNVFGDGQDEHYLKKLVQFYELERKIIFKGKSNDIKKVWAENQFLILASLMEGTPLVVIEAMLCGRFAVATDVGGNREWVEHEINGFIAEAPTVYSIDKTLEKVWEQQQNWEEIGMKARQTALKLYDPAPAETVLKYVSEFVVK